MSRTVLVQAADSVDETRFLLTLADRHAFIAAVVGWVDFENPETPATLAALATHPRLRAVRPMIQDIADPGWMLRPGLAPAFDAVERLGLVFDALVKPRHLQNLVALARARPGLPIVLDEALTPADRRHLHYGELACRNGQLVTAGAFGWTMVVTGTGLTVGEAQARANRLAERILIPNVRYRRDIGDRLMAGQYDRLERLQLLS